MGDNEKPQTEAQQPEGLAHDVARLYSFANAEDVPYRAFSRAARLRQNTEAGEPPVPPTPPVSPAKSEPRAEAAAPAPPVSSIPVESPPSARRVSAPVFVSAATTAVPASGDTAKSAIAVISVAGGVGKTTITANLGRILSARGEHVLLVDSTWAGLLPFYFGAEEMRHGVRTFHAPEPDMPPMRVVGTEYISREWLTEEVMPAMQTAQRTILDIGAASLPLLPEILPLCAVILIPLVVDINSIMSLPSAEAHNEYLRKRGLDVPKPTYILNKFNESSEREQHGRELILREVGDRLLPFPIRRSPEVTEAISGRMTVVDYAPESAVVEDLAQLAAWIQKTVPVAQQPATHSGRWSEA